MLKELSNKDVARRLYAAYPDGWSPEPTWDDAPSTGDQVSPNLKAVLQMLGAGWKSSDVSSTGFYDLLTYIDKQTRLTTATGFWLDLIARDFTNGDIVRHQNELDDKFRHRLQIDIMRPKVTRCALECGLANLTGYAPTIIEPLSTEDCGAYGSYGGYGVAGAYGSLITPFQVFVTAIRPVGEGIPTVNGYSMSHSGYSVLPGNPFGYISSVPPNYGTGQYASLDEIGGDVTDADIYQTVADTMSAGCTAWTQIISKAPASIFGGGLLDVNFYLDYTSLGADPSPANTAVSIIIALDFNFNAALNISAVRSILTLEGPQFHIALVQTARLSMTLLIDFQFQNTLSVFGSAVTVLNFGFSILMESINYLGNVVGPFILGQSELLSPGGKLGRTFLLGQSKLGNNIYGY